jgi:hypothetical protein
MVCLARLVFLECLEREEWTELLVYPVFLAVMVSPDLKAYPVLNHQ